MARAAVSDNMLIDDKATSRLVGLWYIEGSNSILTPSISQVTNATNISHFIKESFANMTKYYHDRNKEAPEGVGTAGASLRAR